MKPSLQNTQNESTLFNEIVSSSPRSLLHLWHSKPNTCCSPYSLYNNTMAEAIANDPDLQASDRAAFGRKQRPPATADDNNENMTGLSLPTRAAAGAAVAASTKAKKQKKAKAATTAKKKKGGKTNSKKKQAPVKVEVVMQRAPNYQRFEDIALCKAYVNCTENPIVGNDQKADTFWNSVLAKYNILKATECDDNDVVIVERDANSIRNRFQRTIAKTLREWNPFYKKIATDPPSGTPKEQWPGLASELYLDQYGRKFQFEHCVEILHQLPKFDPMVDDVSDDDEDLLDYDGQPVPVNNTTLAMGSNMERPIGNKKAKQLEKDDKSLATFLSNQQDNMNKLATSNEHIAKAMDKKNRIQQRQLKINSLWKQHDYYDRKGNELRADEIMDKINALLEEEEEEGRSTSTEELKKKIPKAIDLENSDYETPSKSTGLGSSSDA